jgi:predicted polyphosphate/ATP-dependent NAD kinase
VSAERASIVRLGLVVNPIAGIGGKAALKGSDDAELLAAAIERGAEPVAPARAETALAVLGPARSRVELLTAPGAMGEHEARAGGFEPIVVGEVGEPTSAVDTRAVAAELAARGVDLLLFVGGDGTAVDVLAAVGTRVPVLGVPAGVKMHSACFAVSPASAGEAARRFLEGGTRRTIESEVMDVDEEALRAGSVSARLHGYLRTPEDRARVQSAKSRSGTGERLAQQEIARYLVDELLGERLWLVGPGTTTRVLFDALRLPKTLLGVDAVRAGKLVASDADERRLLELVAEPGAGVVLTPVGGQGFLLGRGNQQLSPRVLERVGRDSLLVCATETKLAALGGRPLLVETGDPALDELLSGYTRVVTGYGREVVYLVAR